MEKRDARSPGHSSARAEHLGRCSGCSKPSDGECSAEEGRSYGHDMEGRSRAGF